MRAVLTSDKAVRTLSRLRLLHRKLKRFLKRRKWMLQSRNPQTFGEKLMYKVTRDRRPLLTTFADKVAVRDYVAAKVGPDFLTKIYAIEADADALSKVLLPRNYVLKPSHASGAVLVIWEGADPGTSLPVLGRSVKASTVLHPDRFRIEDFTPICRQWLARTYSDSSREWFYERVRPQIIAEELLLDEAGRLPPDYKLFVFHGVARWIQVDTTRFSGHSRDLFSPDWTHLPVEWLYPHAPAVPPPPRNLDLMLQTAGSLGADTDSVRVDMYDCGHRVVVGELTNCPEGGNSSFRPPEYDRILGQWWHPPRRYVENPPSGVRP